jgi:hypothetical protein
MSKVEKLKEAASGVGCGRKVAYPSLPQAESTRWEDYFWTFYRASVSSREYS